MFRAFQVNEGRFLPLESELSPTARVSELCSAVRTVGHEAEEDQVMLTSDGKQMDPSDMIGAYSVGMESKPIFVFYRSYLNSPHPPTTLSRLPRRGELDLQLELLHHKPTPSLFQKLVVLSKRLSEYAVSVGGLCGQLSEEYQLQYSGWCTALANCNAIVRTYQKHHQLFTKEVDTFRATKPEFIQLLKEFPERVELLRQLPMPSTLQEQNPASSLYDWINTHDDRNTLLDLSRECKKAMSNLDNVSIDAALNATHRIAEETTKLHSQDDQSHERVKELAAVAAKAAELRDTVVALAQNIQSTSDRARRYGDAGTIADLVMSHHRSLQMMSDSSKQLDSLAKGAEQSKVALMSFIHTKLQQVAKLQERVAHSNGQLLLIHEHIKLARKRFEILRQVCHTPQVLAHVLSEVDRRMAFSSALEKRAEEVGRCLKQAREEEKQLRRTFVSKYGQHFIATLFPELMERVPDVSVHLPRSLSKSSQSYHTDLERMRQLLPPEMRPSPASASMQLLSSPLLTSLPVGSSNIILEHTGTPSTDSDRQAGGMDEANHRMKESSVQTASSSLGLSEETKRLESRLKMMEASNGELSSSLTACTSELENLKQQLEEKDLTTVKTVTSLEESRSRLQAELSQRVKDNRELCDKVRDNERIISDLESTNKMLLERCDHAEKQVKQLEPMNEEVTQRAHQLEEEMNHLRTQNDLMTSEKLLVDSQLKQKVQELESLELRQREFSSKQDNELKQSQLAVLNLESRKSELLSLNESSKAENLQLKLSLSQLESANKECMIQIEALKTEAFSEKTSLEREKVTLEEQVRRLSSELKECQSQKDALADEVNNLTSTSCAITLKEEEISQLRHEVQEAKESYKQITEERDSLMAEIHQLRQQCKELEEEQSRQALRHQRAQSTISNLKSQMTVAESKAREYRSKLEAAEIEVKSLQNKSKTDIDSIKLKLSAAEGKVAELKSQITEREAYISTLLDAEKAAKDEASKTSNALEEKVQVLEQKLKEEVDKMKSSADSLTEELEREKNSIKQELTEKVTELESITFERDSYHKQAMEHERELKELQRSLDRESPHTSLSGSPVKGQQPPEPKAAANTGSSRHLYVSIASLREGDVALFVNDSYGNYLALVSDSKIYYLNQGSVPRLKDLGEMVPQLGLKRKILVGRVTGRMFVEVRKEGNRLKVPVGTRMYKLDAETVFP